MKQVDSSKRNVFIACIIFMGVVLIFKLGSVQLLSNKYKLGSKRNSVRKTIIYPSRGILYDRNSNIIAFNKPVYDIFYTPIFSESIDTTLFLDLLDIKKRAFKKNLKFVRKYSFYKPSRIVKNIEKKKFIRIQERLHEFPGFSFEKRMLRKYPFNSGAHLVGYVGEVDEEVLETSLEYNLGDEIGKAGIEQYYEFLLKGKKGVKYDLIDSKGRKQGSYKEGEKDIDSKISSPIQLTVDMSLQSYIEELLKNKSGALVAMEPFTGEILAMASSPSYSPNLLTRKNISKNYFKLAKDTLKPIFNRAIMAEYPPGSVFKIIQSLIALQQKKINKNTSFSCNKTLLGCHNHPKSFSVDQAVKMSCNPYFYNVFKRILYDEREINKYQKVKENYDIYRKYVLRFGLGKKLNTDLPGVKYGFVPKSSYYDSIYGESRWLFSNIYSQSIGQGELLVTPLQLANLACIVSNRGYYYTPHIKKQDITKFNIYKTRIDSDYFELVIKGMYGAVNLPYGTCRRARIKDIAVCGKTGTAQNPHGQDHSIFIGFAPRENPKIAVSVFLENSGFGGAWAAPLAALVIEKYLNGKISNSNKEKRIFNANRNNMNQD